MKNTILLFVVLGLSALPAYGQAVNAGQVVTESKVNKTVTEEKAPALTKLPPKNTILGKPVIFGGYFTDFFRAENRRALFDLRTPVDLGKDLDNLWIDPGTDKIQGTILFAIKF